MLIVLVGKWSAASRRALEAAGLSIAGGGANSGATLQLVASAKPPSRPPPRPWLWCPPKPAKLADAMTAVRAGAYDVVAQNGELVATVARRADELASSAARIADTEVPRGYVARSAAARSAIAELARVAPASLAVLITGEPGTGVEAAVRYLHARSGRSGKLVAFPCAAIARGAMEGELFGYARGALAGGPAGSASDRDGRLQLADGGTLWVDALEQAPRTLQAKLLRVIEDRAVSRLGDREPSKIDVRVIAAMRGDPDKLVRRGVLDGELIERLAIARVDLPPLRRCAEDIAELVAQLLARFYRDEPAAPHRVAHVTAPALAALRRYAWPGNLRELRNAIFQALIGKRAGDELLLSDLPEQIVRGDDSEVDPLPEVAPDGTADSLGDSWDIRASDVAARHGARRPTVRARGVRRSVSAARAIDRAALARLIDDGRMNLKLARDELERAALELALARAGGSPTRAARLLGEVGRGNSRDPSGTVRAMLRRHGLL